jgi:putative membrane protein
VPYSKLVTGIIVMILAMLVIVTGPLGLAIAGIALCLGLLPPLVGVRRVHLMGCIMLPVICFNLGLVA